MMAELAAMSWWWVLVPLAPLAYLTALCVAGFRPRQ